jgi:hypothetical protein
MAKRRKRGRGLGAPIKQHASKARQAIDSAETHARLALTGSCSMRLTSLTAAIRAAGQVQAQAFGSGGRVAKGALSPKTVSTADAVRAYAAMDRVDDAVSAFRASCVRKA